MGTLDATRRLSGDAVKEKNLHRIILPLASVLLWSGCKNPSDSAVRSTSSRSNGEKKIVAGTPSTQSSFNDADLQKMNLGELSLLVQERGVQNEAEKKELALLAKLNPGLCFFLEQRVNRIAKNIRELRSMKEQYAVHLEQAS